jgi:endonuclease YncB( thermonuclease family)
LKKGKEGPRQEIAQARGEEREGKTKAATIRPWGEDKEGRTRVAIVQVQGKERKGLGW